MTVRTTGGKWTYHHPALYRAFRVKDGSMRWSLAETYAGYRSADKAERAACIRAQEQGVPFKAGVRHMDWCDPEAKRAHDAGRGSSPPDS